MIGNSCCTEEDMKIVDVKQKGTTFQIIIKDTKTKCTFQKNLQEIIDFHQTKHAAFYEPCSLCNKLAKATNLMDAKIKPGHVYKFLKAYIEERGEDEEYKYFFYPQAWNCPQRQYQRSFNPTDLDEESKVENPKVNSFLSVSVSNPKPKYCDEMVEELHRLKHQLALQDSFSQQGVLMEVKVKHQIHNYVLMISRDSSFEDFVRKVNRKMSVAAEGLLKFFYKDEENDLVIVEDEDDFKIAVKSKMEDLFLSLEIIE